MQDEPPYVVKLLFPPHSLPDGQMTQKRKLPEEDYKDYRQKANQLLDAHMQNDKSEALESILLARGFDQEWVRMHKILAKLRSLKESFVIANRDITIQMKSFELSILLELKAVTERVFPGKATELSFKEDFRKLCKMYFARHLTRLEEVYWKRFYELSAPLYDQVFVPFCAMLFMHLQKLLDGKFLKAREARTMLTMCVDGLCKKPFALQGSSRWEMLDDMGIDVHIKVDNIGVHPASNPDWQTFAFFMHNFVYLGTPDKFVLGQRQRVSEWALELYTQLKKDYLREKAQRGRMSAVDMALDREDRLRRKLQESQSEAEWLYKAFDRLKALTFAFNVELATKSQSRHTASRDDNTDRLEYQLELRVIQKLSDALECELSLVRNELVHRAAPEEDPIRSSLSSVRKSGMVVARTLITKALRTLVGTSCVDFSGLTRG